MCVTGWIGWMPVRSIVARLLHNLASFLFGVVVLGWIATQVRPQNGLVLIHVADSNVIVTVDDQTFTIEDRRYTPISCTLPEGRHSLQMCRGDKILYAEEFDLRGGQELILNALDLGGRLKTSILRGPH
jgi:hypothetical protein